MNVWLDDIIISSCLLVEYAGFIHAHLEGNHPDYLKLAPFKLMIEDIRVWGRSRACHTLHLGGGRGAKEDSLFYFKAGMSKRRHAFCVSKWIVDPSRYEELVSERHEYARVNHLRFEPGEYFPAYRAPFGTFDASSVAASEQERVLVEA